MTTQETRNDVRSFVATVLLDGSADHSPITVEDAFITMVNWIEEDVEFPEGMSPAMLASTWNEILRNDSGCR